MIIVIEDRERELASIMMRNPELLLKLAATSMGLSLAVAKLYTYQREIFAEIQEDIAYFNALQSAYEDCGEVDLEIADGLLGVSAEVDKLLLELDVEDE